VPKAADVSTGRLRRLPWDDPALGHEPGDVPVVDAVPASMSIPFVHEPVKLRKPGHPPEDLDGRRRAAVQYRT
jgi:predicted acylesterase/phospholipase RssA